jgi:acetyl esterase/lipase
MRPDVHRSFRSIPRLCLSMNVAVNLKRIAWIVVAAACLAAPLPLASLAGPAEASAPRPVLLLIHGGGFFEGSPEAMDYAAGIAAAQGAFVALQPSYPLNDLPAAFRHMRDVALDLRAQGRPVYAYGDSAGGAIAAWLASRGYVLAAGAKSPPTALRAWHSRYARHYATALPGDRHSWRYLGTTPRTMRAYSSAGRPSRRPLRIFQSCEDTVVPCAMNIGFARRDPRVSLTRVWGQHGDPASRAHSFALGLRWLTSLQN